MKLDMFQEDKSKVKLELIQQLHRISRPLHQPLLPAARCISRPRQPQPQLPHQPPPQPPYQPPVRISHRLSGRTYRHTSRISRMSRTSCISYISCISCIGRPSQPFSTAALISRPPHQPPLSAAAAAASPAPSSISRPALSRADTANAVPRRARVSAGVETRPMAPTVVASSISREGRPWPWSPRQSRRMCQGGRIRPSRPSVCIGRGDRVRRRPEGRGRRHLAHHEARVEEGRHGRRGPTEWEDIRGGQDASHGAGRRGLVHIEARKAAAVNASSISRPVSRRADTVK